MQEICSYQQLTAPISSRQLLRTISASPTLNSDCTISAATINRQLVNQLGERYRSISNHSRHSQKSSDSRSTAASSVITLNGKNRRKNHTMFGHSNRNQQSQQLRMRQPQYVCRGIRETSSLPTGEKSKQRLGIDPASSPYRGHVWCDPLRAPLPLPPSVSQESCYTSNLDSYNEKGIFHQQRIDCSSSGNVPNHVGHSTPTTIYDLQPEFKLENAFSFSPRNSYQEVPSTSPCSTSCTSPSTDIPHCPLIDEQPCVPSLNSGYKQIKLRGYGITASNQQSENHLIEDDVIFSPSSMITPSHNQSTTGCTPSRKLISKLNMMTDSQSRLRQSNTHIRGNGGRSKTTSKFSDDSNSVTIKRSSISFEQYNDNGFDDKEIPDSNSSNAKPAITPLKTGKKVQYRKTKVCPWNGHGRCVMGDKCNYAHSKTELRGRPDLTRTRLCPNGSSCTKPQCRFAHDVFQLRATGAFFRTKLCKFWVRGGCPSGDHCRHAHGEEQLRPPEFIGPEDERPREAMFLSELCANQNALTLSSPAKLIHQKLKNPSELCVDNLNDGNFIYAERSSSIKSTSPKSTVSSSHERSVSTLEDIEKPHLSAETFSSPPIVVSSSVAPPPVVGSRPPKDLQNYNTYCTLGRSGYESKAKISTALNPDYSKTTILNDLSEEFSAAVSGLLLGHDEAQSVTQLTCAGRQGLDSYLSSTSTESEDDEMKRLVEALASVSVNGSPMTSFKENKSCQRIDRLTDFYIHNGTPSQISRLLTTDQHDDATSTFPQLPFSFNALENVDISSINSPNVMSPPALVFPASNSSAADLKLNDILNFAVATQDPDLLECSAKILRASLQYKKKQVPLQQTAQEQVQVFTHSPMAPSTTSTTVSSLPTTPRLMSNGPRQPIVTYSQRMFENDGLWSTHQPE